MNLFTRLARSLLTYLCYLGLIAVASGRNQKSLSFDPTVPGDPYCTVRGARTLEGKSNEGSLSKQPVPEYLRAKRGGEPASDFRYRCEYSRTTFLSQLDPDTNAGPHTSLSPAEFPPRRNVFFRWKKKATKCPSGRNHGYTVHGYKQMFVGPRGRCGQPNRSVGPQIWVRVSATVERFEALHVPQKSSENNLYTYAHGYDLTDCYPSIQTSP